jgi:hypothetical protein
MMPSPPNVVFGIRADGRPRKLGFPTIAHAEAIATGLFDRGYASVEVIDLVSKRSVKRVSPSGP